MINKIVVIYNILMRRDGRRDDKRENMEVDTVRQEWRMTQ